MGDEMPELIVCRVCGREVASSAKRCPHCGDPNPNYRQLLNQWGRIGVGIAALVAILILLWIGNPFGTGEDGSQPTPSEPGTASIDKSVKANVGFSGPTPTEEEIGLACAALREAGWDYMAIDALRTATRTVLIASAINLYSSGTRMVDYCNGKLNMRYD